MSIELNDNQIQQIISLLGYKQKENKEILAQKRFFLSTIYFFSLEVFQNGKVIRF